MKKTLLVISSLLLSGVNAKEIENPHDDYILNAPDYLATIPTEFSSEFANMMGAVFRAESAYQYNNDVTNPVTYIDLSRWENVPDVVQIGVGESYPKPEEYMDLLKAYNDGNAFEQRRLKSQIKEVFDKFDTPEPFGMLSGKTALFKVKVSGSYPFDFDNMSKTLVLPSEVCSDSMGLGSETLVTTRLAINPFGQTQGNDCLVEVKFTDESVAEKFEDTVKNNQISAFIKADYVGYGTYNNRYAIGNELVFVKKDIKEENTYKVDRYAASRNAGKTITQRLFSYEYLTSVKPLQTPINSKNLMATMPSYSLSDYSNKFAHFEAFLDFVSKGNVTIGNQNTSFRIDESGDIELAVFRRDSRGIEGALGKYRVVVAGDRTFAVLTSQYQAGSRLPRIIIPDRVSQRELVLYDLEGTNDYSIRTSRWNPDDLASILTDMGYSEDKLKAVDTGFPYDAVKPIGAN